MPVAYLPNIESGNTQQTRRRVNDLVETVTNQVGSLSSGNGDIGTLNQTKAPVASPVFQNSLGVSGVPTHTSASAGSATALPATPSGYVEMQVNGKTVRVAYY